MAWIISRGPVGVQPITETSTTQRHPLGMRVLAIDPTYGQGEFIYLTGLAATGVGDWVTYLPDDWTTVKLIADARGPVAVAMSANVASQYGWYQIFGKVSAGNCLTAFADNGRVFCTASAGYIDDASVTGDLVTNAIGASTSTARTAEFEIFYPYVDDASSTLA